MKNKVRWNYVFKYAGSVAAFIIGSGFATGQEILQFFSAYGTRGILGALLTMLLLAATCAIIMDLGYQNRKGKLGNIYYYCCGKRLGRFMEWFTPIFCFLMLAVMISGAGATLNQYMGLPPLAGRVMMTALTVIVVFGGLNRLINIIGCLGPFTIIVTLIIGVLSIAKTPASLAEIDQIIATAEHVPYSTGNSRAFWPLASVLYAAYNMTCSLPFMSKMGATANSRKEAVLGGVLGSVALMLSGLILALAMMVNFKNVSVLDIPILYLAQRISPLLGSLFTVVLLGEIFSTAMPLLWTATNAFAGPEGTFKNRAGVLVVAIAAFGASVFPFGALVGTIYPFTGYIGSALIACVIVRFLHESRDPQNRQVVRMIRKRKPRIRKILFLSFFQINRTVFYRRRR